MSAEMDPLIASMRDSSKQYLEHEHPPAGSGDADLFCLNLASYMGSRMHGVLQRLDEARAEAAKWKSRHDALAAETEPAALQLIDERDLAEQVADELAEAIGDLLGIEIGEHSNVNNPRANALAAAREAAAR